MKNFFPVISINLIVSQVNLKHMKEKNFRKKIQRFLMSKDIKRHS